MTRNQKRNIIITICLVVVFIAILSLYWKITNFNPFVWVVNHSNTFIVFGTLGAVAVLMILGFWFKNRRRI